jgi:hypothetical protein
MSLVRATIMENKLERLGYDLDNSDCYKNIKAELNNSSNRLLIKNFSKENYNTYNFYFSKRFFLSIEKQSETFINLNNSDEKIKINRPLTLDFSNLNYETLTLNLSYINDTYFPFKIDSSSFKNENSTINFEFNFEFNFKLPLFKNLKLLKNFHLKNCLKNIYFINSSKINILNIIKYDLYNKEKIIDSEILLNLYSIIKLQKIGINFYTKDSFSYYSGYSYLTYKDLKTTIEQKIKIDTFINICEDYLKLQEHSIEF